jgi:hypothetical protein
MSDEFLEQLERQIASLRTVGSPVELRGAVLCKVQRELRASQWDQCLMRVAALLLMVGVGLNVATRLRMSEPRDGAHRLVARSGAGRSLVDTAVVVAEATGPATGSQFARRLAAMSGRRLTVDELAAIDAAVRRVTANGNKG